MSRPAVRFVTEFLVIVAGVTVGLLADDWRQDRELHQEERRFLEDVLTDLADDSVEFTTVRDRFRNWDVGAIRMRAWMERPEIPPDTLRSIANQINGLTTYEPTRSAFERMKASGRMNFLGDRELQRSVGAYYETLQPYLDGLGDNLVQNTFTPWSATFIEWMMPARSPDGDTHWATLENSSTLDWVLIVPWNRVRTDPRLPFFLNRLGLYGANVAIRFDEAIEDNHELQVRIRTALEETR